MEKKRKSENAEKENIKKSYTKPMLEELGDVSGLTKGIGGHNHDSGGISNNTAIRPPSLP